MSTYDSIEILKTIIVIIDGAIFTNIQYEFFWRLQISETIKIVAVIFVLIVAHPMRPQTNFAIQIYYTTFIVSTLFR